LQANQYNVNMCDSSKTINHFRKFSGGGDLYITGDNSSPHITGDNSSPLIFVLPADEDSSATATGSQEYHHHQWL